MLYQGRRVFMAISYILMFCFAITIPIMKLDLVFKNMCKHDDSIKVDISVAIWAILDIVFYCVILYTFTWWFRDEFHDPTDWIYDSAHGTDFAITFTASIIIKTIFITVTSILQAKFNIDYEYRQFLTICIIIDAVYVFLSLVFVMTLRYFFKSSYYYF